MKREFWAEFDLYQMLAKKGDQIWKLRDNSQNEKNNKKKKQLDKQIAQIQRQARDEITKFIFQGEIGQRVVPDPATRLSHLAQLSVVDCVCEGKKTQCKDYAKGKKGLQHWYYAGELAAPRGDYQTFFCCRLRWMGHILSLTNHHDTVSPLFPDLTLFPPGAWAVQIHFALKKPYLSKDDVDFYIIDNPVKKEWVFKVPYVAPSQWKGALRSVMIRNLASKLENGEITEEQFIVERLRLYRLFGNEKDGTAEFLNRILALHRVGPKPKNESEEKNWQEKLRNEIKKVEEEFKQRLKEKKYLRKVEGFQGCLHFYPTFFDRIGLEVINPHDRKTGAGKQPIYFECVPADTSGVFMALYVPLDRVGRSSREDIEKEAKADLEAVAQGIRAMLTEYGFGAKTSSGYGVAKVIKEESTIKAQGFSEAEKIFWEAWNGKG